MSLNTDFDNADQPVIGTAVVEAFVAFVIFLLGVVVMYNSLALGAGWSTDGPGAGYFPFYIGVILSISGGAILLQTMFGKEKDTSVFVRKEELGRVLSVLIPAAIYVAAIYVLGIYVASAIYIALFMIVLGKFSPLKSILIALGVNVVFFMMFEVWFQVPLFKGLLQPLAFLGY